MLLNDLGSESRGGNGYLDAEGVVAVAGADTELSADCEHGAEIYVGVWRGILCVAVQHDYVVALNARTESGRCGAVRAGEDLYRLLYFADCGHSGGKNHRNSLLSYPAEVWKVGDLARGHFHPVLAKIGEQVDRSEVKRSGHESDAHLPAIVLQTGVVGKREMYLAAHVELRLDNAGIFFLIFSLRGKLGDNKFGHRSLKLDIVGARFFGGDYHSFCGFEVTVMVDAGFGDYYASQNVG